MTFVLYLLALVHVISLVTHVDSCSMQEYGREIDVWALGADSSDSPTPFGQINWLPRAALHNTQHFAGDHLRSIEWSVAFLSSSPAQVVRLPIAHRM